MKKLLSFLIIVVILLTACSKENTIRIGEKIKIFSHVLNEERVISIHLPESYDEGEANYPVLYLLDGETHFVHGYGAAAYLGAQNIIPEMIVVAIENVDRNRDFSPVHVDNIATSGSADKFLAYIADELMPYINDHYRSSSYDVIMGHSFGGVFITYALLERPELFDGYISISPFLQFADEYMIKETFKKLKTLGAPVSYYMSIGAEPAYYPALDKFSTYIDFEEVQNLDFAYKMFDTEDHMSNPYPSLYYGLRYIFRDWVIPNELINEGLEAIEIHYGDLSEKYGIEAIPPENILNNLGYAYLQNGDTDNAITVFLANIKYHPESPNVYDSYGEALENNGQFDLAKKNYKKAWDLAVEQDHQFKDLFKTNYERVISSK